MNLTPEMILRGYQANTAALEEMIFVKGKVAIVTGGTSGLGFCVARRLCQGGAKVVLASSTREKGDLEMCIRDRCILLRCFWQRARRPTRWLRRACWR